MVESTTSSVCLFCNIISSPDQLLFSDEVCAIFRDKCERARIHLLCCPKIHIRDCSKLGPEHIELLKHMRNAVFKYLEMHEGIKS